ncbi:MAG TPA: hypothetical protein PKW17_10365 [Smithellaceae bacterium]|mgnify:FL=1|nr:hypothetical protein [Smithellaceae bacterium]
MSYQSKVYRKQGGEEFVVADGGTITVESGGTLALESGSVLSIADGALEAPDIALAQGSILVGDSDGKAAAISAKTSGQILVGNGTTVASVAVSGDVTMDATGAVTIAAKAVEDTMISAGAGTVLVGTKTDGDVTLLDNSAAGSIVIGQGAGETCAAAVLSGDVTMDKTGKVTLALPKLVAADDSVTMSYEENIAGLSSAITLANEIRGDIINHFGNATRHTTGLQSTAAIEDEADDLASLIALTNSLMTLYAAHNADMVLGSGWAYHSAQGAAKALSSEVATTTLADSITMLNDIKAKYNDHEDETTGHADQSSVTADQVAATDADYGDTNRVTVANVATGDIVFWNILDDGTGNVTGISATAGEGYIDFKFSANPQDDAIVSYLVIRPAAS